MSNQMFFITSEHQYSKYSIILLWLIQLLQNDMIFEPLFHLGQNVFETNAD